MSLHVVLGATGGAGGAVVRELVRQGKPVRAVSRSGGGSFPKGVEVVQGDVKNSGDAKRVCEGSVVVYNCANVPYQDWLKTFPAIVQGSIEGAASAGAKLVFCDNLYMYGPPNGPMTEATPRSARGKKGRLRAELEQILMQAHKDGRVRVVIGRGSDFYGPGANSVTKFVFGNILKDKRALWPVALDMPHSLNYSEDFAKNFVTLGEEERALGEIWHLPASEPLTGREFIRLAFQAADEKPKMGVLSGLMIRVGGLLNPMVREFGEVSYQFARPFVMNSGKFERAFGAPVTPHHEAIARTLEFYKSGDKTLA